MSNLDKLLKGGNLILLAAYIKGQCGCDDDTAWDMAYGLCDALDDMIRNHIYEEPEFEEFYSDEE